MSEGDTAPWMIARKRAVITALVFCATASCGRDDASKAASASPSPDSVTAATVASSVTTSSGAAQPSAPTAPAQIPATRTRPHLQELAPGSGSVTDVNVVEVRGEQFTPGGNTLYFGRVKIEGIASRDGKSLKFTVPQTFPPRGEAAPMTVPAGAYAVYVVNANGTSDTLRFTLRDQ